MLTLANFMVFFHFNDDD